MASQYKFWGNLYLYKLKLGLIIPNPPRLASRSICKVNQTSKDVTGLLVKISNMKEVFLYESTGNINVNTPKFH